MDLVNDNLKLAYSIANKKYRLYNLLYPNLCLNLDDLKQEALIGLYKATLSFDKSKDINFSTFAYTAIKRTVQRYIFTKCHIVKVKEDDFYNLAIPVTSLDDESEPEIPVEDNTSDIELEMYLSNILNEREKDFIVRHYIEGVSQTELARQNGLTQAGVRRIIQQGLGKLRNAK